MNPELLNLLLLTGVVMLVCLVLYLMFKVIDTRPDIVALLSFIAIAAGVVGLTVPNVMTPANSILMAVTGCLFLVFAGFTYNRNRG